jgi:hypothetical protein
MLNTQVKCFPTIIIYLFQTNLNINPLETGASASRHRENCSKFNIKQEIKQAQSADSSL